MAFSLKTSNELDMFPNQGSDLLQGKTHSEDHVNWINFRPIYVIFRLINQVSEFSFE